MILPKTFIESSASMFVYKTDIQVFEEFGMLRLSTFRNDKSQDFLLYSHDSAITNIIKSYCFHYLGKCL